MNVKRLPIRLLLILLLTLAGMRAFAQTPDLTLQTRPRYALRAGDTVTFDYRYTPEYNQTVTIQPDGFVNLNIVGDMRLAGMTLDQVHALVVERASARLNKPEVTVTLKEFEHPYIVVAGEVDKPGRFDFYEKTTAMQAVLLAGGFKEEAQQSDIYVFRRVNGDLAEVHKINLHKLRTSKDLERDLTLEPGDMVLVPPNKLAHISRFIKATNLSLYFDPLAYTLR
ncbi:polysaccharide export outer membrane protein [Granulicella rosea]|uniref:Polysaccharide export outer membrane protein n=1 Tax=Granulicella rosea TaxID=474952 RepID=A0A239JK94_9BACT|nr:polysaccharide biosynthesis/export family protein [Granulicella rosea]SNT06456.1 polysaccharide export outer membrane protein [Granulicella rosea]